MVFAFEIEQVSARSESMEFTWLHRRLIGWWRAVSFRNTSHLSRTSHFAMFLTSYILE